MRPQGGNVDRMSESEARGFIDTVCDGVGNGVDEGIKNACVGFLVAGIPTDQSCDGHGRSVPWVRVYLPGPEGWKDSEAIKDSWRTSHAPLRSAMEGHLAAFNAGRPRRLYMWDIGAYGGFVVLPEGRTTGEQVADSAEWLAVMDELGDFLKSR